MISASVPLVKRVLRAAAAADGRRLLDRLLELTAARDIEREVRAEMARKFPGLLENGATASPSV
jgi:phosphotransferase system enzyme I (PtsI)